MELEMTDTLNSLASMLNRSRNALTKFSPGTSQYTLLVNRINALNIAFLLAEDEMKGNLHRKHSKEDLDKALPPMISLISKSEKALQKLKRGTWQHTMTEGNLKALRTALPLLYKALSQLRVENG